MGLVFTQAAIGNLSGFPHKVRAQLIKEAKALIVDQHPPGSKKLEAVATDEGEPIYRQRSGDYRILHFVRQNEVIVLDIGDRKDVYRIIRKKNTKGVKPTPKTENAEEEYQMKESEFDKIIQKALGASPSPSKKHPTKKKNRGRTKK